MAKKKLEASESTLPTFNPAGPTGEKFPVDISGGRTPCSDCVQIPIDQLVAFEKKEGRDFSRDSALKTAMVESIKEDGVIELLTVRPLRENQFEILAGESRWQAAMEAGEKTVPCRIVRVDDARAHRIFAMSNLMRRTLTPADKVKGCWHYYQSVKADGKLGELRQGIQDDEALVASGINGPNMSYRTIMLYAQLNTLIPEWLELFDAGKTGIAVVRYVALFPDDIQKTLLDYAVPPEDVKFLYEIYKGKNASMQWSADLIAQVLKPLKTPKDHTESPNDTDSTDSADSTDSTEVNSQNQQKPHLTPDLLKKLKKLRKAKKQIVAAVESGLQPDDYASAADVISGALKIYYADSALKTALRPDDYERADEIVKEAMRQYYERQDQSGQ